MKTIKILVFGILLSTFAISQEIGINTSRLWTNDKELGNPNSFGVYLSKNLSNYFTLRLSYDYAFNERKYNGSLGSGMDLNSVWEPIETFADANLLKLSIVLVPYSSEIVSLNGGFLFSTNYLSVEKQGLQTQKQNRWDNEQKFGIGYLFLIRLFPFQSFQLTININASKEFMSRSTIFVTDVEMPFYQSVNVSSIQFGLGYIIK